MLITKVDSSSAANSWKGYEIYRFNGSTTQNFICWPTIVAKTFEDFEPSSKEFLPTPLCTVVMNIVLKYDTSGVK